MVHQHTDYPALHIKKGNLRDKILAAFELSRMVHTLGDHTNPVGTYSAVFAFHIFWSKWRMRCSEVLTMTPWGLAGRPWPSVLRR